MNKIITVAMLLIMSVAHSQIKVTQEFKPLEIGKVGSFGAKQFLCTKLDDTYTITFRDINFSHLEEYKSFQFEDIDNAFENLYTIIMDGLENIPEDGIFMELPNGDLKLNFIKTMGVANANMTYTENGISGTSGWITKRQTIKLFGKKK